jgi:hypothetical protein
LKKGFVEFLSAASPGWSSADWMPARVFRPPEFFFGKRVESGLKKRSRPLSKSFLDPG